MALVSGLAPGQMPLLLDALDAAATPVRDHLEPYALVVPELDECRRSRRVGSALYRWTQFFGVSADTSLFNREKYFGMGATDLSKGTLEERFMVVMYCAYRCTSGSTADRHAYYASEEMTALILTGSETSADVSVTAADLPSPAGVAYLDQGGDEEGLVLIWHIAYDELLTVQLVPVSGVDEFLANDGSLRAGWGYIHADCRYLPIPGIEAVLSAPETDEPPTLRPVGGFTSDGESGCTRGEANALLGLDGGTDPAGVPLVHPHDPPGEAGRVDRDRRASKQVLGRPDHTRRAAGDVPELPTCSLRSGRACERGDDHAQLHAPMGGARALEAALVSEREPPSPDLDRVLYRRSQRCAAQDVGQGAVAVERAACAPVTVEDVIRAAGISPAAT
ncbi:hypothetical protein GS503_01985 [Rhodococcus hoagii]|nr:hypothetical protein [Prescottella equi]NKR72536.1 hypothetical protein [Prescottella equi]